MKEPNETVAKVQGQHTPGPWEAWDDDGTGTLPCVLAKQVTSFGNFYVAQCNVFEDARLIAEAPALLKACEALADLMESPHDYPDSMFEAFVPVEAIRKAHDILARLRGTNAT